MKILLICMTRAYGDPAREYSYEYINFYLTLQSMGHEVEIFDYMEELRSLGKAEMNKKLVGKVRDWRPNLGVFSLYTDQLEPSTVDALRKYTKTFCFFHDDTWRVDYSRSWAKHFDCFSTPDVYGERKYADIGLPNAIYFPFGCNEKIYHKTGEPKKYDVTFVGAWHPYREWLIQRLRHAGFKVEALGYRWPGGIVSHEQMVALFNESRINLNLSNSTSWDARYLLSSPRALINRIRSPKSVEQLKARHFEINGCGAFQLSYYVEGLESLYGIGSEVAVYLDPDDLLQKVRLYLSDETLRETIAAAGYARTMRDHRFESRFRHVFDRMGLINV